MIRGRSVALAVTAWAVGAATAVGVGLLALSSVGTSYVHGPADPLAGVGDARTSPDTVASGTPSATATPTPSARASTVATTATGGSERQFTSAGGNVVARCTGADAYLVYWSPAAGYHAGDVVRGPATSVRVQFEGAGRELTMTVTCVGGVPQAVTHADA